MNRDQRGFTLIELLVAASLMIVVLSATLTSFNRFVDNNKRNQDLQELQENIRNISDRMVTQLRNLANPTSNIATIKYAGNTRIVFQTTDPSKQWVSYCLNNTAKIIWYQTSTRSDVADQSTAACPSTTQTGGTNDWLRSVQVGPNITNGASRPLFEYATDDGTVPNGLPSCASGQTCLPFTSSALTSTIERVTVNIFVDDNTSKPPNEVSIESGAFMRNQNQAPTANFNITKSGTNYSFNGGLSTDPEDRTLSYYWYQTATIPADNQMPGYSGATMKSELPDCKTSQTKTINTMVWTCIGTGATLSATISGSPYAWLLVVDPGALEDLSDKTSSTCPAIVTTPNPVERCRQLG